MAGSIRLYGGSRETMPALSERMPGFCTDTEELYIGTEGGNTLLASAKAARGEFDKVTLGGCQLGVASGKLVLSGEDGQRQLAFAAERADPLGEAATAEELIAAYNGLIDRLKACGAMKE